MELDIIIILDFERFWALGPRATQHSILYIYIQITTYNIYIYIKTSCSNASLKASLSRASMGKLTHHWASPELWRWWTWGWSLRSLSTWQVGSRMGSRGGNWDPWEKMETKHPWFGQNWSGSKSLTFMVEVLKTPNYCCGFWREHRVLWDFSGDLYPYSAEGGSSSI